MSQIPRPRREDHAKALSKRDEERRRCSAWRVSEFLDLFVSVHERDNVDRDVVSRAQSVVGYPPASILQDSSCSHYQILSCHRVPEETKAMKGEE